jgi:CHRD domain-containing protein
MLSFSLGKERMLKHRLGFVVSLCILLLVTLNSSTHAEALRTVVHLTPDAVVPPPVTPPTALSVNIAVTVDVNRDASGNIMPSAPYFFIFLNNQETVEVTGVFLREGAANANGPIALDLGLSDSIYPPGRGTIVIGGRNIDLELLQRLMENPNGFYFELRTTANPDGALRGQLHKFTESLGNTVALSPLNEVPPVTDVTAIGTAAVTINPTRNSTGEIVGGKVTFSVLYDLPANSEIIGLNIHKQVAGMIGDPVISSGISCSNSIITPTGRGKLSRFVRLKRRSEIETLKQLIENPAGFYVNLQTKTHESGLIRGQLSSFTEAPVIHLSDPTALATGGKTPVPVDLIISEWDLGNFDDSDRNHGVLINGKPTDYSAFVLEYEHHNIGNATAFIFPEMLTEEGTLFIQVRNSQGLLSAPSIITVAPEDLINSTTAETVGTIKSGDPAAPEAIPAILDNHLTSQPAVDVVTAGKDSQVSRARVNAVNGIQAIPLPPRYH